MTSSSVEMLSAHRGRLIAVNWCVAAFCTATQLALNAALSLLLSNSIVVFSLFTGIYLAAMGVGVLWVGRLKTTADRNVDLIFVNALVALILANPGIFVLLFLHEAFYWTMRTYAVDVTVAIYLLGVVHSAALGMVSGLDLPLATRIFSEDRERHFRPVVEFLVSDYVGAFVGAVLFVLVSFPMLGLVGSVIAWQVFLACVLGLALVLWRLPRQRFWRVWLLGSLIYVAASVFAHGLILATLDGFSMVSPTMQN